MKLLDLGIARLGSDDDSKAGLTSSGQMLGTPDYMAPEQWDDTHSVDARADLYSLGCTLGYLLTGKAPFDTGKPRSFLHIMKAHSDAPPPDLTMLYPSVPAELNAIFQRLLAKQPADRFATAAEVVAALESFTRRANTPPPSHKASASGQPSDRDVSTDDQTSTSSSHEVHHAERDCDVDGPDDELQGPLAKRPEDSLTTAVDVASRLEPVTLHADTPPLQHGVPASGPPELNYDAPTDDLSPVSNASQPTVTFPDDTGDSLTHLAGAGKRSSVSRWIIAVVRRLTPEKPWSPSTIATSRWLIAAVRRLINSRLLLATMVAAIAGLVVWAQSHGARITVINSGPYTLSDTVVVVACKGDSIWSRTDILDKHQIGTLAVGESRTVWVSPSSEPRSIRIRSKYVYDHFIESDLADGTTIEVEFEHGLVKQTKHELFGWRYLLGWVALNLRLTVVPSSRG